MEALLAEEKRYNALIDRYRSAINDAHARLQDVKAKIAKMKSEEAEKAKEKATADAEAAKPSALKALNALGRWMTSNLVMGEYDKTNSDLKYKTRDGNTFSWFHYPFADLPKECAVLKEYSGQFNQILYYNTKMITTDKEIQLHQFAKGMLEAWQAPYKLVRDFQKEFGEYLTQLTTLHKRYDGEVMINVLEKPKSESESESEAEAESPKPKANPASQVPNMDDKYLLLPEQFTVGAEFHASNKQTYVVSDKEHKLPRKIGDSFYMKKKGGKNNILFNVAYDFRIIQSEKSDYAFTEENYQDEFNGSGAEKFYKPDGTKMTYKEAKAKFGGTHKTGQSLSYSQTRNINLGYLKNTSAQAAPAPKKAEAPITIPKKEFVAEHKELVKVLKEDKPKAVAQEAKKQAAELKTTLAKPIASHTMEELVAMIKEHLAKKGKTAALSHLNKSQLLLVYKQVVG